MIATLEIWKLGILVSHEEVECLVASITEIEIRVSALEKKVN